MKREDESSLELLLDTMCNTFGGVMFIAISLVVIISMTSSAVKKITEDDSVPQNVAEANAMLEDLQTQVQDMMRKQDVLVEENNTLAADPRLRDLKALALLEDTVEKQRLAFAVEEQARIAAELARDLARKDFLSTTQELQELQEAEAKSQEELDKLTSEIQALAQEREDTSLRMSLTTKNKKEGNPNPYWVILKDQKIWRVGPEDLKDITTPHDDVTANVGQIEGGFLIECIPVSGKGFPALSGDAPSAELRQLFSAIPQGRVLTFWVHANSAETFYKLRESLKQRGIFHGFDLIDANGHFTYITTTEEITYEY